MPTDVDVRFLPNPHYQLALRPLNGNDPEVAAYLETSSDLEPFLDRLFALIDFVVPRARRGQSRLPRDRLHRRTAPLGAASRGVWRGI